MSSTPKPATWLAAAGAAALLALPRCRAAGAVALQQGRLGGAGLDVFADEPNVPAALQASDRVVLTPHTASATRETRQAMADRVADNLEAWFSQGRLVSAASAK